jgi:rhomboid protease GluP
VSVGLDKGGNNLLQVKAQTLIDYGGNFQPAVLDGQVYRLISAMFLHIYFMHIFGNLITTFMFLSRIEYTFGWVKTLIIYLVCGISGNIFSVLCSPAGVKAGASTALFGIIGIIIGYIIINWNGLDLVGAAMKCQIWCTALLIIVFIFIFTPSSSEGLSIDYYGHLGGFLAGVWISAIHTPIINETR